MKTKQIQTDIVISGGGPAGLTLTLLLASAGLHVTLIDPEDVSRRDQQAPVSGRTAALLVHSVNVLRACGVWDDIQSHAAPLKIMKIVDGNPAITTRKTRAAKEASATFHAEDIGQEEFGFNIPNAHLKSVLGERVEKFEKQGRLTFLRPEKLEGYELSQSGITARTQSGMTINARLIIGTDGRGSRVRAVAGIDAHSQSYGQRAITCLITHSKPHNFQSTEFHRQGGPFTLVSLPGNMSSVVWVEKEEDAQTFLAMKKQDFEQALQDRSQGLLGQITLASTPESWPLMRLKAHKLTAPRAALAAEAAHVLSPIGAQGLNLSLRDVAALAETLVDAARLGEDIGSPLVLDRYEERRQHDIGTRVLGIDGLNRLVTHETSLLQGLRRTGLRGLDKIGPLKHAAMKQGLTPVLDDGRLLRGEAL